MVQEPQLNLINDAEVFKLYHTCLDSLNRKTAKTTASKGSPFPPFTKTPKKSRAKKVV